MSVNVLYHKWFRELRQLWPDERLTRVRLLAWFLAGLYTSRSVQLHRIALKIPSSAQLTSVTRRLSRFLQNPWLRVRSAYEPMARALLEQSARTVGEIRLILDTTSVGANHRLLMVALAYRRRALPLAWTWVRQKKGLSAAQRQLALLVYVKTLLPRHTPVLVVGDTEFGAIQMLKQLDAWGWHYVLRQKANFKVCPKGKRTWQPFGHLVSRVGEQVWWEQARLTRQKRQRVNLLALQTPGEPEPWLLATNLPNAALALQAYRRRMWIEELFGDLKRHGFDLASTHLRHIERLSRLTLLVALLYLWLVALGSRILKEGTRWRVDRRDRRDLSLFQIGLRSIEQCLTNELPLRILWRPYWN